MMQRFVLAKEACALGMVNQVVPTADLDSELILMAQVIAKADPFHLRMIKLTCNQAQDHAGYAAGARGSLSHWTAYRWDWNQQHGPDSKTKDHGGLAKTLAPIKHALSEPVISFSRRSAKL